MAIKETVSFILLVTIPVAMMAKQPLMPKASTSDEDKAIVQTKGKCNVTGMKEQIEAIKRQLDNLSTEVESCQPKASCSDGWLRHGSACYYIDDTPTENQVHARTTCQNMGADLPVIRSAAENNFIFNLTKNQDTVTFFGAWLGMHRSAADSKFYWFDGAPAQGHQYQNWRPNEPNNENNREHCGQMFGSPVPSSYQGMWNDVPCDFSRGNKAPVIICQIRLPDCVPA